MVVRSLRLVPFADQDSSASRRFSRRPLLSAHFPGTGRRRSADWSRAGSSDCPIRSVPVLLRVRLEDDCLLIVESHWCLLHRLG